MPGKCPYWPQFPLIFHSTNICTACFSSGTSLYSKPSQTLLLFSPASPTSCCFTNCSTCSIAPTATTLMGRKFAYFFICNTSESSYLPVALSSCSHVPSPYCIVPRDFSALLGYCIVPCAGCLWCFLMENDLKNANCEIPWTADWESLNYFLLKIFSKIRVY